MAKTKPSRPATANARPNRRLLGWDSIWPERPLRTPRGHLEGSDDAGSCDRQLRASVLTKDPGATAVLPHGARRSVRRLAPTSPSEAYEFAKPYVQGRDGAWAIKVNVVEDAEHQVNLDDRRARPVEVLVSRHHSRILMSCGIAGNPQATL
jgi:hypothetical protein